MIAQLHPDLRLTTPAAVRAETADPHHMLIDTSSLNIDARPWAQNLSRDFNIDIEKATADSILILSQPISDSAKMEEIQNAFSASLEKTITSSNGASYDL